MASISVRCCLLNISCELKEHRAASVPGSSISLPCQSAKPGEKGAPSLNKAKGDKRLPLLQSLGGAVMKLSKEVKESLSPKQKGDWKDLLLMSISFAVYVYMSQKIVCAYCVWISMLKQQW